MRCRSSRAPRLRSPRCRPDREARGVRDGHWTLDLALANPAAIGDLELRMRSAGVPRCGAIANGVRMRIGGS
jgi:hypothetical protein